MAGKMRSQKYEKYKSNHTREKNKIIKIKKHLKQHPNNVKMLERIQELEEVIKK